MEMSRSDSTVDCERHNAGEMTLDQCQSEMAPRYDQLSVQTNNRWIFRALESLYYHSAVNK